ncbi:MAG: hypothetical protein IIA40_13210, partial [SAR324 cluster bacterium]|nr:hypothetical protein [SAR324 cluster bacterium]
PEKRKFNLSKRAKHTMKDLYADADVGNDVIKFAQEKNIFTEIDTTIKLYNNVFGHNSRYNIYLGLDPEGEENADNGFVVFEIRFEGNPQEFRRIYKLFVKEWLRIVPENHQDYITFAFHINR